VQPIATQREIKVVLKFCQGPIAHCNTLQHPDIECVLESSIAHCNTLQHTATHCNTQRYVHHTEKGIVLECVLESYTHYHARNTLQHTEIEVVLKCVLTH